MRAIWPRELNVVGTNYTVSFKDTEAEASSSGGYTWGSISPSTGEIKVWDGLCDDQKNKTLLHEIFHAISMEMNSHSWQSSEHYEQDIDNLAAGFYSMIQRSGDFSEYIQSIAGGRDDREKRDTPNKRDGKSEKRGIES